MVSYTENRPIGLVLRNVLPRDHRQSRCEFSRSEPWSICPAHIFHLPQWLLGSSHKTFSTMLPVEDQAVMLPRVDGPFDSRASLRILTGGSIAIMCPAC